MGYTTKFTGCINLSRALTLKEAKELLEIADLDRAEAREITGTDAYLQWVPTETLDGIVWDGNEKFYEYVPLMIWLCGWLKERGIEANGELMWSGEEAGDCGRIVVSMNAVAYGNANKPKAQAGKPLTLRRLAEMALEQVAE